jgi:hypothetical protein
MEDVPIEVAIVLQLPEVEYTQTMLLTVKEFSLVGSPAVAYLIVLGEVYAVVVK